MTATPLLRAGVHARRSLNRIDGQSASVSRQLRDGEALAARVGARVVKVYDEDDTSAFAKRVVTLPDGRRVKRNVRPTWQEALADLYHGRIDVLIEYDLDRAMREPRDLEDLIEVIEATGRQVESVTGSLRLRNDHEITMARVMVAMANKSSRDTARRVTAAARERANAGRNHGGMRAFGYTADGKHLQPAEAAEVARAADQLLSGVTLASIAKDLNVRGVTSVRGGAWTPNTVREMLLRPRHAGLAVYRGEVVGRAGWPAILSEDVHRAVVALLTDPARRLSTGTRAAYLLSGLARCGHCGGPIQSGGIKAVRRPGRKESQRLVYRCRTSGCWKVTRRMDWADEEVSAYIVARLSRDDAVDLLADRDRPDLAALTAEARAIQVEVDAVAAAYGRRTVSLRQLEVASADLNARLTEIDALRGTSPRVAVLRDLVGAADVGAVWAGLSLDRRRAVVAALVEVTFFSGGAGARALLPGLVVVAPKA